MTYIFKQGVVTTNGLYYINDEITIETLTDEYNLLIKNGILEEFIEDTKSIIDSKATKRVK